MKFKQVTNPLIVENTKLNGYIELKRSPRWSSVFWSIESMDRFKETSDKFSPAGISAFKHAEKDWFFNHIKGIIQSHPMARHSSWVFGTRWGVIKGIHHDAAVHVSDFILDTWNEIINSLNTPSQQ